VTNLQLLFFWPPPYPRRGHRLIPQRLHLPDPRRGVGGHPRSRCPHCQTTIHCTTTCDRQLDSAQGRCAYCGAPFSIRYPLVEALTGALFALFFYRFGVHQVTLVAWLLAALLVTISFIDLDHQIIPMSSVSRHLLVSSALLRSPGCPGSRRCSASCSAAASCWPSPSVTSG